MNGPDESDPLERTRRRVAAWLAKPDEEREADLKRIGILDAQGRLSSRYGGPGDMTWPHPEDEPKRKVTETPGR